MSTIPNSAADDDSDSILPEPLPGYEDLEAELDATRRMLERFPDRHADWKPHEKSMSLARLATHVADMPNRGVMVLTEDELDVLTHERVAIRYSAEDLVDFFNEGIDELWVAVDRASDAALDALWTLRAGDRIIMAEPKRALLRHFMISHMIHHRAQLGVYYRLLGVPVPGMYGPSADEV